MFRFALRQLEVFIALVKYKNFTVATVPCVILLFFTHFGVG